MLFNNRFGMRNNCGCGCNSCCNREQQPIMEPVVTNCIEKEFYREVPHVCPIHTHTINRHIYTHTYTPQYSCSEEDQVINNDCGSCSNFRQ